MGLEFLTPINEDVVQYAAALNVYTIGSKMVLHTQEHGIPDLEGVTVALVGVPEYRGAKYTISDPSNLEELRRQFYQLFPGNWNVTIADLGNIEPGASVQDTYFALKEVTAALVKQHITPIVLGGTQDLTYATYRAYDQLDQMVNLVAIDSSFDLVFNDEGLHERSFLNSVIQENPPNLSDYANIGYQVYYNSQEAVDLMEKLFFEYYRLGEATNAMNTMEPVFRNADLVSVDMKVVQGTDLGNAPGTYPNGFNSREICGLARYAGISDKVSCYGIYNMVSTEKCYQLTAQVIWYFIEGVNYRFHEYPFGTKEDFLKYIVPVDDTELIFYKSNVSGRWWIEITNFGNSYNNFVKETLIPCTEQDYIDATQQNIPERWWRIYRKSVN
ncbi:formimidoylglutamase [Neptunitalea lumnitzerae]|uniref:Arginase n=1 Tax=Neptunitalea lumnitzerae TaxID=2965509 RepID=A0ABQ5MEC6_9FLAO|nr:formimidoylglutamase [Neptunitalea sp. Y10]GLB47732.1 arginase [Neptunitalea sp. Y10]